MDCKTVGLKCKIFEAWALPSLFSLVPASWLPKPRLQFVGSG